MKIIRTNRKTLQLEVNKNAELIVRAPFWAKDKEIEAFINKNAQWIDKKIKEAELKKLSASPPPTKTQIENMRKKAKEIIPPIVEKYSKIMNLTPTGIKITSAKSRFGSCSGKNSLCFSLYLLNYPDECIEYVVVHELAHIKHHNHSKAFYSTVEKYLPDYKCREKLLKSGGNQ